MLGIADTNKSSASSYFDYNKDAFTKNQKEIIFF